MLSLNNVEVKYAGAILVLKGVTVEIPEGKIVCLLGANGAGKTTALKAISGLLKSEDGEVTGGSIHYGGKRIDDKVPADIVKMGIAQVMEGRRIFGHLTVEENLKVGAHLRHDMDGIKRDIEKVYGYFSRLKTLRRQTSGYISGGEQQMLAIGRALMARPKLLLLDEPSLGLAPMLVQEIYEVIKGVNEQEQTPMLLVEQNARAALSIGHYGYVLENGKVVLSGTAEMLRDNADIKEFYLGLSTAGERRSYRDIKHYKRRKRWLN